MYISVRINSLTCFPSRVSARSSQSCTLVRSRFLAKKSNQRNSGTNVGFTRRPNPRHDRSRRFKVSVYSHSHCTTNSYLKTTLSASLDSRRTWDFGRGCTMYNIINLWLIMSRSQSCDTLGSHSSNKVQLGRCTWDTKVSNKAVQMITTRPVTTFWDFL